MSGSSHGAFDPLADDVRFARTLRGIGADEVPRHEPSRTRGRGVRPIALVVARSPAQQLAFLATPLDKSRKPPSSSEVEYEPAPWVRQAKEPFAKEAIRHLRECRRRLLSGPTRAPVLEVISGLSRRTIPCERSLMCATKPTPHASCSSADRYSPWSPGSSALYAIRALRAGPH
jgi:hypothetical protein